MPARRRHRRVRWEAHEGGVERFEPRFAASAEPPDAAPPVRLDADELEALRLADLQGLYHAAAAREMGVSRATFGRIAASARRKVAAALVQGRVLELRHPPGPGPSDPRRGPDAGRGDGPHDVSGRGEPQRGAGAMKTDQETTRIGVALDAHGNIARHFGHSVACRVYEVRGGVPRVVEDRLRPADAATGGRHAHSLRPPAHEPGDGLGEGGGPRGGNGRWIAEVFAGCDVVVTAGLGAGAKRNLQALGARVVVTDHPRDPDAAVGLLAQGKL